MSDRSLIAVLCIAAVLAMIGYMTLGVRAPWSFVLPFRGEKLIALVLVALAVSTSTVLFQTISFNRILTPAIMGFDALYLLLLTMAVFLLGGIGFVALSPILVFILTTLVLICASVALFGLVLGHGPGALLKCFDEHHADGFGQVFGQRALRDGGRFTEFLDHVFGERLHGLSLGKTSQHQGHCEKHKGYAQDRAEAKGENHG